MDKQKLIIGLVGVGLIISAALAGPVTAAQKGQDTSSPSYVEQKMAECKKKSTSIPMAKVQEMLVEGGWLFIDVRTETEFKKGRIPGAINIPRGKLEFIMESKVPDKGTKILVYCKKGGRACLALCTILDMGYSGAIAMEEGFAQWAKAEYPVE